MKTRALSISICWGIAAFLGPLSAGWCGIDSDANENVLVFDDQGLLLKSYHVGNFTTLVDPTDIHFEDYAAGSPPSLDLAGTQPYAFSVGETWVPNLLGGTFPAPPPGLPNVSLFSFDPAVLDLAAPADPGVSASPGPGTYDQTISVQIQAYPGTASVEVFNDDTAMFETFGNSHTVFIVEDRVLQVRSVDGPNTSDVKSVTYTLDQEPGVDTDGDGVPDKIELEIGDTPAGEPRFNPLIADRNLDSDGEGLPDIDEMLRGSDPDNADRDSDGWSDDDEINLGTDPLDPDDTPPGAPPVYAPPLLPDDTDGDGWFDPDETWRGTNVADASDTPTARSLYEVETSISGEIAAITDTLCAGCLPDLAIGELAGTQLVADVPTTVSGTTHGFSSVRSPRGQPSSMRFAEIESATDMNGVEVISPYRSARNYLPSIEAPNPGDIDPATWVGMPNQVTAWLAAYSALLDSTLHQVGTVEDVTVGGTMMLASLDEGLAYLGGLPNDSFYVVGRPGFGSPEKNLASLTERLMNPVQKPDAIDFSEPSTRTVNEFMETLGMLADETLVSVSVTSLYDAFSPGDDLETLIPPELMDLDNAYPIALAMSLSYDQMLASGFDLCLLLNPYEDIDMDGLANFVEAMGLNKGRESSIFHADTDGDGTDDAEDNCPTFAAGGAGDNDSDGAGDGCDPDDDEDGIDDVVEEAWAFSPGDSDTDDDGWPDNAEVMMGLDPTDPTDALLYHATLDTDPTFAATAFPTPLTLTPLVFASQTSFNNGVSYHADLQNVSASGFESRVDKDPGEALPGGTEQVAYLALTHTPDGWNTGAQVATEDWVEVEFDIPFIEGATPLVVFSIMTETDSLTFHPEAMEIDHTGFALRIRTNSAETPPASILERVAWAAFLPDDLPIPGEAGELTTDGTVQTIFFDTPFASAPDVLVSLEGTDANTVVASVGTEGFQVMTVPDASVGGPAGAHRLSWLALGEKVCEDPDMDGVCSAVDNSPMVYNPDQVDSDGDGTGNVEDLDADNDGLPNEYEEMFLECGLAPFDPDSDGDGVLDGLEDYDGDGFTTAEELVGGSDPFDINDVPSMILDADALLIALEDEGISPDTLYIFAVYWMSMPPGPK